jgi:hypothetical protein
MRLDEKLSKNDFAFTFGPDKAVTLSTKIERGPSRFIGWERAALGVEFELRNASGTSSVKLPKQDAPQVSTFSFSSGEKPLVYRVSVPLWGSSLTLDVSAFNEARYEGKVADKSFALLQSAEASRATLEFRDAQLAFSREKQIDAMFADPKRIVDEVAGVGVVFKGKVLSAHNKAEVFDVAANGGGFHWAIGADEMLNVRYDLDTEFKYGPAFADFLGMNAGVSSVTTPGQPEGFSAAVQKIQQSLMTGASFVTKGALQVTLPAHRVGLRESAAAIDPGFPVPPFEVTFEGFKFRLPFLLSSLMSLDGTLGFMLNSARPIAVNITQEVDALDLQSAVDSLIKVGLESPQFKNLSIDTSRSTPSSLTSLSEIASAQGAFVLVQSSIQALSRAYFSQKAHNALQIEVKTGSGNANVFELMGAEAAWTAHSKLDNGFGWELDGSAEGAKSWKTSVTIHELSKLLRELRAPLMLFGARSALATFFAADGASGLETGATAQQEKELLAFLFSDELFDDLMAALAQVLRVVDQTPDSTNDLKVFLEGSGSDLIINGKKSEEFAQAMTPIVMQEVQALQAKLEPRLAILRVAQQSGPQQESDRQESGEDVQWQEAPTDVGDTSAELNQELTSVE